MISLTSLTIGYPSRTVASRIDATVADSRLTCLIGSNGVGKSTLLKTLCGFLPPLGGSMETGDVAVVLTQRPELQNLTVFDVVSMGRTPHTGFWGTLSSHDRDVVRQSIDTTGISSMADRFFDTLSDGERQKVMIAKAIAQQTPVIILDEPTAFLDYPSKVETMRMLRRLAHEEGKTIFLSTHDLDIALQTTDDLWIMQHSSTGSVISAGTPRSLADDGTLGRFLSHSGISFSADDLTIKINS